MINSIYINNRFYNILSYFMRVKRIMNNNINLLYSGFLSSCEHFPDRPAVEVGINILSYRELKEKATTIAVALDKNIDNDDPALTAILTTRSTKRYIGLLGTLFSGHGYVPLNLDAPSERNAYLINSTECKSLIIDSIPIKKIEEILDKFENKLLIIMFEREVVKILKRKYTKHEYIYIGDYGKKGDRIP